MRRWLVTVAASSIVAIGLILPAAAHEHGHHFCTDLGLPGHSEFGQHVASMARDGHLGEVHHPGMHRGYSDCLVSRDR
jgi:hypothetical protein